MTVRVFLVDHHPMFRAGLHATLETTGTLAVVGEAACGEDAARMLPRLRPGAHVVLMDLQLPGGSGIETIRAITTGAMNGTAPPRVLVVSAAEDDAVVAALRAGAHGYLVKSASGEELLRGVHIVAAGGAVFSPVIADRLGAYFSAVHELPSRVAFPELTGRELQVLDLIARGYDNRRIARQFVLSEKTVRNHVTHLFAKLRVGDRVAAVVRARDAGLGGP